MGAPAFRVQTGQPCQQTPLPDHRGGLGPGRRVRGRVAGRAGLQPALLLLPGQSPPRAQHRRAGGHQRGQELPERWRQRATPVLRHHQGRGFPRPRAQRLSPGRDIEPDHRPVRSPGGSFRARVRRTACQPFLRRRPGVAHLLCPRANRAAASPGRVSGSGAPDRGGPGQDVPPHRDARLGGASTVAPAAS